VADDLRGKKAFCPKCGAPLIVTSTGVAKGNETRRPAPARKPAARGFNPLWLVLPLLLLLLLLPGGVALYLFTRGQTDEPKQVAKNEGQPPPPEPERKKEDPILPPAPERKADTSPPTKPVVIPPLQSVPNKRQEPPPFSVKLIKTLGPMTYAPNRLAFSPDDKTLAVAAASSGNAFSETKLWDLGSGKETATLSGAGGFVYDLGFSPDGKTVTLGAWTGPAGDQLFRASIWDVAHGNDSKTLFTDPGPKDDDFRLRHLSPDGKVVLVGDQNNRTPIKLLNAASGATISSVKETGGLHPGVFFSPDSKTLATIAWHGPDPKNITYHVTIWDVASGSTLSTFTAGVNNLVTAVAISPDSKTLAAVEVVGKTPTVVYWDVAGGTKISSFPVDGATSLAISPDRKTLAVPGTAGLKLYDLASGKCLATLPGGSYAAYGVATAIFSHDGKWLAAACSDKMIRLWEMPAGEPGKASPPDKVLAEEAPSQPVQPEPQTLKVRQTGTLAVKGFNVFSLAFSPDGKTLAGGGYWFQDPNGKPKGQIRLWDVANLKNTRKTMTGTVENQGFYSLSFSPDGKMLVCMADANEVMLWNALTGENTNTFNAPKGLSDGDVAFSRDGKTVVVKSSPPISWDVSTGKTTTLPANPGPMTFSLDGKTGVTAGQAKDGKTPELKLWNVAEGKSTATLTPAMPVVGLAFSADGKTLFSAEAEGNAGTDFKFIVEVWDVVRGKKTRTISVSGAVLSFRSWGFSADGTMLATAAAQSGSTVKLWDLASGKVVAELGHTSPIVALAFSRDGTKVATITLEDRTVHLWELTRGNSSSPTDQ
jgi:WD40 repeat protein